jgi:desulfoferrodoxin
MAKQSGIYKCAVCGNIVEVLHAGGGDLVCCGQPMQLLMENTTDASREKHVPVIEKMPDGVKVKVGRDYCRWKSLQTVSQTRSGAGSRLCRESR